VFVNYQHREPAGYGRCIGCRKQWESRFLNDIRICTMCRMPVMLLPSNPLIPTP
jgi:hypothetical protein